MKILLLALVAVACGAEADAEADRTDEVVNLAAPQVTYWCTEWRTGVRLDVGTAQLVEYQWCNNWLEGTNK